MYHFNQSTVVFPEPICRVVGLRLAHDIKRHLSAIYAGDSFHVVPGDGYYEVQAMLPSDVATMIDRAGSYLSGWTTATAAR